MRAMKMTELVQRKHLKHEGRASSSRWNAQKGFLRRWCLQWDPNVEVALSVLGCGWKCIQVQGKPAPSRDPCDWLKLTWGAFFQETFLHIALWPSENKWNNYMCYWPSWKVKKTKPNPRLAWKEEAVYLQSENTLIQEISIYIFTFIFQSVRTVG